MYTFGNVRCAGVFVDEEIIKLSKVRPGFCSKIIDVYQIIWFNSYATKPTKMIRVHFVPRFKINIELISAYICEFILKIKKASLKVYSNHT